MTNDGGPAQGTPKRGDNRPAQGTPKRQDNRPGQGTPKRQGNRPAQGTPKRQDNRPAQGTLKRQDDRPARRPASALCGRGVPTVDRGPATVDEELGTRHEARRLADQVDHRADELVGAGPPAQSALAGIGRRPLRDLSLIHI